MPAAAIALIILLAFFFINPCLTVAIALLAGLAFVLASGGRRG